ncbi:O-antigen ligase family protein [Planosporangium sp. 12N6]|uniref:O-antigen ligase family protein n=1 Tax=Planosporangium spinosum TaxID=3402278 RepID=UPI003CF73817
MSTLAVPLAVYLLSRHGLFAVIGFAVVAPLVVFTLPGVTAMLVAPVVSALLLAHVFPDAATPAVGGALAALVLGMLVHICAGTARLRREHAAIVLLVVVLGVSLLFPAVPLHPTASPTYDLIGMLEGLILLSAALAAPPSPRRLAQVVALTGAVEGTYALVRGLYVDGRLVSDTLNPNYLGAALVVPAIAAIGLAWTDRRPLWLLAALPTLAALVATRSRGAMVAVVAGLLVQAVVHLRRLRGKALIAAAAAATLLATGALTVVQQFALGGRSTEELSTNNEIRADAARFALHVALDNPGRGIGYGMFAPYAGLHSPQHVVINTHNDYLRLAVEAGVVALLLFAYLLWRGLRALRTPEYTVLGAVVVAYAVGLLFANTLSNLIVTAPFWVALGALTGNAAARRGKGRHRQNSASSTIASTDWLKARTPGSPPTAAGQ